MKRTLLLIISAITLISFPKTNYAITHTLCMPYYLGSPPAITAQPVSQTVCAGNPVSFSVKATGSGLTYQWRIGVLNLVNGPNISGATSSILTINSVTISDTAYNYNVVVSGTAGPNETSVNVSLGVNPLPLVTTGPSDTICYGDTISIGSPTVSGNKYKWTPTSGLSSYTISNPMASPDDTITYTLTVIDTITGCESSDSVLIIVKPVPSAYITAGDTANFCKGVSPMELSATNGATFLWSNGDTTQTIIITAAGTFTVVVTYSDGCSDYTGPTVVVINPLPIANAGPDKSICSGDSTTIGTSAMAGLTYSWTPAMGLSYDTIAQPNASPSVTTTYVLTVTDTIKGCQNTDTVIVTEKSAPIANAGSLKVICKGDSTRIGAPSVPGTTYTWLPATGLSSGTESQPNASPATTTTYTLTAGNSICSSTDDTVTVMVNPLPLANAGVNKSICKGDSTTIGTPVMAGLTYNWAPATGLNSDTLAQPQATPTISTTYTLTVINNITTCSNTDKVTVTVKKLPAINISGKSPITIGTKDTLTATGGVSYVWTTEVPVIPH